MSQAYLASSKKYIALPSTKAKICIVCEVPAVLFGSFVWYVGDCLTIGARGQLYLVDGRHRRLSYKRRFRKTVRGPPETATVV